MLHAQNSPGWGYALQGSRTTSVEFFVHQHIYGKWACKCCQQLRQEPAEPDVIDGGIPAAGLGAHTLISRFGCRASR